MALIDIVWFTISIILIALFLFVGDKIFGTKKIQLTAGYFIQALITAAVIILAVIVAGAVGGFIGTLLPGAEGIVSILGFVLATYAAKIILLSGETYERSTWIVVTAYLLIFIANGLAALVSITLIPYI